MELREVAEELAVVRHRRHERPRQRVVRLPVDQEERHVEVPERHEERVRVERRPGAAGEPRVDEMVNPVQPVHGQPGVHGDALPEGRDARAVQSETARGRRPLRARCLQYRRQLVVPETLHDVRVPRPPEDDVREPV